MQYVDKPYKWIVSANKNQRSRKLKIHLFRCFVSNSKVGAVAECGAALSPFIRAGEGEICERCREFIESETDKFEFNLKGIDLWASQQIY